jgi:hypothetical protein
MGSCCNCSVRVVEKNEEKSSTKESTFKKTQGSLSTKYFCSVYNLYEYNNTKYNHNNLIVYTNINNFTNDFVVIDELLKDSIHSSLYKNPGIGIGYSKGYKLDFQNQDKFFILLDGDVEIYCLIDGHGPFGNIIAQIIQDRFFKEITEIVFDETFENDYERIFRTLFENTHNAIIRKEEKYRDQYDPYLSGAAVALVVKKDNALYIANVGNVMAYIMYGDKFYNYGYKSKPLVINDSNFKAENTLSGGLNMNINKNFSNAIESK